MYPAAFAYVRAESLEHTLRLLVDAGDADVKLLAGGQSLLPLMKLRLAAPDLLVDIGGLAELSYLRAGGGVTRLGALTTYRTLQRSAELAAGFPALEDALRVLADPQVRARGTIGGSLAHADPAADLPAVLLALDARLTAAGPGGSRTVALDDFFLGVYTTALDEHEVVVEVALPHTPERTGQAYEKFEQPASHLALCGVCAVVTLDGDDRVGDARIGVTGVAGRAFRARDAEEALRGATPAAATLRAAADLATDFAASGVEALGDIHASGPYRVHLTRELTRRALERALRRAGAERAGASAVADGIDRRSV